MFDAIGGLSTQSIGNHKQPQETTGNLWAGGGVLQREMPMGVVAVAPLQQLGRALVARMDFSGCMQHALLHSGRTQEQLADQIHVCKGYMSRLLGGIAQAWAKRVVAYMQHTRSLAPLEWMALQVGCELVQMGVQEARLQQLQAELAALTGRRAA